MFPCASVTVTFFVMGVFPSHRRFVIASKDALFALVGKLSRRNSAVQFFVMGAVPVPRCKHISYLQVDYSTETDEKQ